MNGVVKALLELALKEAVLARKTMMVIGDKFIGT